MSYKIDFFQEDQLRRLNSFVALDLETTGLDPGKSQIIELAALKYIDDVLTEEFVTFINPHTDIPHEITKITGITDEMVADAPELEETLITFMGFTEGLPIVAHNSDFDISFIDYATAPLGFTLENGIVDTLKISRDLFQLDRNNLASVATHLGITPDGSHRARADAKTCAEILIHAKKDLQSGKTPAPRHITVTQLNKYIKGLIERDPHLHKILVKAEISNYKRHFSGHLYLTLKDEQSAIRAVMFKGAATNLKFQPENGMKVLVEGRISVYERDGQYQLYIERMQPDGLGDLHLAFEQLKEKLQKQGIFEQSRKKPIPKFPKRVGIVTSPTGAAVRDIINVITRRYPTCEIILYPAKVQGDGGAAQVAAAIRYFNKKKLVDVIIAGRGGGSIEELWVFNEEEVALAIAASDIPIISAVGHETDFTIADFAADLRAPTPSAAAELAVPSTIELLSRIRALQNTMLTAVNQAIHRRREILRRFALRTPADAINQRAQQLDNIVRHLTNAAQNYLTKQKNALALQAGRLNSLSPLGVLERGYSVASCDGKVVYSVKTLSPGQKITTRLKDGEVISQIESVYPKKGGAKNGSKL